MAGSSLDVSKKQRPKNLMSLCLRRDLRIAREHATRLSRQHEAAADTLHSLVVDDSSLLPTMISHDIMRAISACAERITDLERQLVNVRREQRRIWYSTSRSNVLFGQRKRYFTKRSRRELYFLA